MRALWLFAIAAGFLFFSSPAAAETANAGTSFREFVAAKKSTPPAKSPVEDPADWIAVGGVICWAVIPAVILAGLGYVAYRVYVHNTESALLFGARDAWIYRGASAGPPPGMVLLAF